MALFAPVGTDPPGGSRRRVIGAVGAALLGFAALSLLIGAVGADEVGEVIEGVDARVVVVALVLKVLALACLTQVYRRTFRSTGGRLATRDAVPICLGAFSLTQLLPAGGVAGAVYAARRLTRHGADRVTATTTVLLVGTLHMGTLALAVGVATTVATLTSGRYAAYAGASAAVTVLFASILVLLHGITTRPTWRSWTVRHLDRLRWRGAPIGARWAELLAEPPAALLHLRTLRWPVAWSAATWTVDVLVLTLLVHAVGGAPPFLAVLVAFAAAHLLAGLPATPGGLGLVEAGLAGTLLAFGMDAASASVVGLSYRAVHSVFPVVLAGPVLGHHRRRAGAAAELPLLDAVPAEHPGEVSA